jgi:hypothetical protein
MRIQQIHMKHKAGLYRWEFEKRKKSLSVAVNGPLIVDDLDLVIVLQPTVSVSLTCREKMQLRIS